MGVTMMQVSVSDELSTAAVLLAARDAQAAAAHHFSSLPFMSRRSGERRLHQGPTALHQPADRHSTVALPAGCITMLCPCITAMNIAPEVEQNAAVCCIANAPLPSYWLGGCLLRQNFRAARDIDGGVCGDFFAGVFCSYCLLCQMSRELSTGGVSAVLRMER